MSTQKFLEYSFESLMERNNKYMEIFRSTALMQLITSSSMEQKKVREKLLECIQVFSNFFQKSVLLRTVFTENAQFLRLAQQHLDEEFNHNISLLKDRKYKEPLYDSILEATACWFCWKMMTLDNKEKTFLTHQVLEASAGIFFVEAHKVMNKFGETEYFKIHAEIDEFHHNMGVNFYKNLREDEYIELFNLQHQAWEMLFTTCNRIAEITDHIAKEKSCLFSSVI